MAKECLYCGNDFKPKLVGRPKKFCRSACRSLYWKSRNRLKANAHNAVYKARKKGKLAKQSLCDVCKKRPAVQSHHPNYKKPLKIIEVCRKCHRSLTYKREAS